MNNKNKTSGHLDSNADSTDEYVAQLAFIGAALSTIGDGISTIAAGIAIHQLETSKKQDAQDRADLTKQMGRMQKQINELTLKIEKLERNR